jgi:hypothetical protein
MRIGRGFRSTGRLQCHVFRYKSHMTWSGIEPETPLREAGNELILHREGHVSGGVRRNVTWALGAPPCVATEHVTLCSVNSQVRADLRYKVFVFWFIWCTCKCMQLISFNSLCFTAIFLVYPNDWLPNSMAPGLSLAVDNIQPMITIYPWFQALRAVTTKSTIFWGVTPCTLIEVHRSFGRMYCLHVHGRRVSQASNRHGENSKRGEQHRGQTRVLLTFQPTESVLASNPVRTHYHIFIPCHSRLWVLFWRGCSLWQDERFPNYNNMNTLSLSILIYNPLEGLSPRRGERA